MFRLFLACLAALCVTCPARSALAQVEAAWLGAERGPWPTGTLEEVWIDDSRDEASTRAPDDKRHLTIQIWYPADPAGREPVAVYAASVDAYDQFTRDGWGLAASRPTHSRVGPALSSEAQRYPVILYSHGFGNPGFSGTSQTEFLASHGYVVVAIGHTGWDGRIVFPDGYRFEAIEAEAAPEPGPPAALSPVERYRLSGKRASLQRVYTTGLADVAFVLDRLTRLDRSPDSRFYRRLDLSHIGGLGFSNGGATYFQATISEQRIDAAVNMDGGLNGLSVLREGARKPILLVQASQSYPTVSDGPADAGLEEMFAEVTRETWQMLRLSSDDWYKATIIGTEHPHFSDAYLIVPAPDGMIAPAAGHSIMNRLVLEFFDRYLRGNRESPILDHTLTLEELRLVSKLPPPDRGD